MFMFIVNNAGQESQMLGGPFQRIDIKTCCGMLQEKGLAMNPGQLSAVSMIEGVEMGVGKRR